MEILIGEAGVTEVRKDSLNMGRTDGYDAGGADKD